MKWYIVKCETTSEFSEYRASSRAEAISEFQGECCDNCDGYELGDCAIAANFGIAL